MQARGAQAAERSKAVNLSDPATFIVLACVTGVVLVGFYFALRELIADGILLAEKKRKGQKEQEREKRK